jgi:iron(III) transport system permease protein
MRINGLGLVLAVLLLSSWGLPLLAVLGGTWQANVSMPASVDCSSWAIMSGLVVVGVSLGCLIVGTAVLSLVESLPARARWQWLAISCMPLAIPPYLLGLAWAPLLSPVGLVVQPNAGGCALPAARSVLSVIGILVAGYYPIAVLGLRAVHSAWHAAYDEAASVSGLGRMARLRLRANWYCAPVAGVFALIALPVLGEFAVADYYGVRTLAAGVFAVFAAYQNPHAVTSLLIPLMLAAVLLAALASLAFRRTQRRLALNRRAESGAQRTSTATSRFAVVALLIFIAVTLVMPMSLLMSSLAEAGQSTASLATVWKVARGDLTTSIWLAAAVSALTLPMAFAIALTGAYARSSWEQLPRVIAWAAFLTPPSLWGLGALLLQSELPPGIWLGGSMTALLVGMILRSLALGTEMLAASMARLPRSYLEAAAVSGLPRWQAVRVGLWKPIRTTCWSALVLIWVWALGDITLTVLVAPAGTSTLMLRIFQSVHYGPPQWLAALTAWHLAMTAAGIAMALLILRGSRGQRRSPWFISTDRNPHAAVG